MSPTGTTNYWVEGVVAVIELHNPPLNVVSLPLTASLDEDLVRAARDKDVRAVVIVGSGNRAFCAGSDIGEFSRFMHPGGVVPLKLRAQNEVFSSIETIAKPTVAALNGLAYGGGLEIALCCDLIVADESVRLALPETRLGVFPSSGGPVRLARRIGPNRAKRMIFTAEAVSAKRAEAIGLIDEIVPNGTARSRAIELAASIARGPALGITAAKDLIDHDYNKLWRSLREESFEWSDRAFSSRDCQEGVRAFKAREEPVFTEPFPHATGSEGQI